MYDGVEVVIIQDGNSLATFDLFNWRKMDGIYYDEVILSPHYFNGDECLRRLFDEISVNDIIQINESEYALVIGETNHAYWNLIGMNNYGEVIYMHNFGRTMKGSARIIGHLKSPE